MKGLIKLLKKQNIFISIVFQRNANREKQWYYVIDDLENQIYKSTVYNNKKICKEEAILKAFAIKEIKSSVFIVYPFTLKRAAKEIERIMKQATV